jgi:hypothetical protein
MNDPAGLLQRIPELEQLEHDAKIRAAVESGDSFKVYRALLWAKLTRRLPERRALIDALVKNRRPFAQPMKGSPSLFTFNSFGTALTAETERAADGTGIATHAVVVLFKVPLLPLGAYLVKSAGIRSWTIYARVPIGLWMWLYRSAVATAAIAAVLFGAFGAVHASRFRDVRVFNAFDQAITVHIGPRSMAVPPHRDAVLRDVPIGKQPARAEGPSGLLVDQEAALDVSHGGVLVWNLAGAGPLLLNEIHYADAPTPKAPAPIPPQTVYCGARFVALHSVDYLFRDPDKQVKVSKGQGPVKRTQLDYPRAERDLPALCIGWLAGHDQRPKALGLAVTAARLAGWAQPASHVALSLAALEPKQLLELAKEAVAATPSNLEANRDYQNAMMANGESEQLLAEYRKRAEAAPDSGDAQYLYARLVHGPEGAALVEKLAARFPTHPYLQRSAAWVRFQALDWKGAVDAWTAVEKLDPAISEEVLGHTIVSLAALGRTKDGLELAKAKFDAKVQPYEMAIYYARLARLMGQTDVDALVAKLEAPDGSKNWRLRASAGLPVPAGEKDAGAAYYRAVVGNAAAAASLGATKISMVPAGVPQAVALLSFAEAARTGAGDGDANLAKMLSVVAPQAKSFIHGEPASLGVELEPELRAALCLVRSRNASLSVMERKELMDEARRLDVLRGPVSEAMAAWQM